jgi:carbamoyl-phosphate synthase large subunit
MAKIMVIAGGDWQIELIKKAKAMGHYVICSNLYEVSPAFPYADACEVCNVLDKEGNLRIAQKYQPDAVISDQSDIAVPTVAYVSEKMGLR